MKAQSGQRMKIDGPTGLVVETVDRSLSDHLTMIVVTRGKARRIDAVERGVWNTGGLRAEDEIIIGTDERSAPVSVTGGFKLKWPGNDVEMHALDADHRAVILGTVYDRQGTLMIKISGEGYAYGLDAYGRRNGVDVTDMLPRKVERQPQEQPWQRQPHQDGSRRRHDQRHQQPFAGAQGSGVSIAPGIVVTNHHVIENGRSFTIIHDGATADARLVTSDEFHDLAILRHEPIPGLVPIAFRDSAETYLGEDLVAAGFPLAQLLGDDLKITSGNISGLKGTQSDVSRLQFTAPIASGSSGGAIVDVSGRLIGVVAAALAHELMRSNGGTSENVNFAIKASLVREMMVSCGIEAPKMVSATSLGRQDLTKAIRSSVVAIASR